MLEGYPKGKRSTADRVALLSADGAGQSLHPEPDIYQWLTVKQLPFNTVLVYQ